MASFITAGNATNGLQVSSDNTGILELKSGTGSGTTAISISTSQVVTGTAGNLMLISGTLQASTSGTSIDFTGIPSWVKRIIVMFNGTSVSGTSPIQVQLGTVSGVENTGYVGSVVQHASSANNTTSFSAGFQIAQTGLAAGTEQGFMTLVTLGSNIWAAGGTIALNGQALNSLAGNKTTSGALDRIRITTVNGTDTFDAGSINILYE